MINEPLISVIIPIYNTEKYLSDCIKSIVCQTYQNLEIILVNDGSTDQSKIICDHYAQLDSRVRIINQVNTGVTKARENGVAVSVGEYIYFIDSDDTIDPETINTMYKSIQTNGTDACVLSNCSIKNSDTLEEIILSSNALKLLCMLKLPASMCAYLYKASILKEFSIDMNIQFFEDFLFNYNYLTRCNSISLVDGNYYRYRFNINGANASSLNDKKKSCLKIYDKIEESAKFNTCKEELQYFRAHCLITILLSTSKLSRVPVDVSLLLHTNAREMKKEVLRSEFVDIKYKVAVFLLSLFPKFTIILVKFLYIFRRKVGM